MTKIETLKTQNNTLKTASARKEVLNGIYTWIKNNTSSIEEALKKDLNKSEVESWASEIQIVLKEIRKLKFLTWYATRNHWDLRPSLNNPPYYKINKKFWKFEPYETVFIMGPFNYPFHLVLMPLVGAIAAGNKALIKVSDKTPHVAKIIEKLVNETNLKNHCLVMDYDANIQLIKEEIDSKPGLIFFTGSHNVGSKIDTRATSLGIQTIMELGSPCPVYIDKDADLKIAAKRLVWAKMYNSGQTCVSPNHFLIHQDVYDIFKNEVLRQLHTQFPDFETVFNYGQIINQKQLENLQNFFSRKTDYELKTNNLTIIPEILDLDKNTHSALLYTEIFCNIFTFFKVSNYQEALDLINEYNSASLSTYVFTKNKNLMNLFMQNTTSGSLAINDALIHISNLNLPFGGVKKSGHGRYHGKFSIEAFSQKRAYYIANNPTDWSLRYTPHTKTKTKILKKIIR